MEMCPLAILRMVTREPTEASTCMIGLQKAATGRLRLALPAASIPLNSLTTQARSAAAIWSDAVMSSPNTLVLMSSGETRVLGQHTLRAATTCPPRARMGTDMERSPSSNSWSTMHQFWHRTLSISARNLAFDVVVLGVILRICTRLKYAARCSAGK